MFRVFGIYFAFLCVDFRSHLVTYDWPEESLDAHGERLDLHLSFEKPRFSFVNSEE